MRRTGTTSIRIAGIAAAASAAMLLSACAAAEGDPTGTWLQSPAPEAGEVPQLVLAEGGGLSGTDGCNILGGGWSRAGNEATFMDVISTQIFCEDVDDWLKNAATATAVGPTLTVKDADGNVIGELQRVVS